VLALDLSPVRRDAIDPRLDPEAPASGDIDREAPRVTIVPDGLEPGLAPARRTGRLEADRGTEHLVTVPHDRRPHLDAITDDALDGSAAAVDLRFDRLHEDAARRICRFG
jgi:hypothetical protein